MHAKDRIARMKEVEEITGLSRTSIKRNEAAGCFPRRVKLGKVAIGYRLSEVIGWLDSRQVA